MCSFGSSLCYLGQYKKTLIIFSKLGKLYPENAEVLFWKRKTFFVLDKEEAMACYDYALSLDPHYEEAWIRKGIYLISAERFSI